MAVERRARSVWMGTLTEGEGKLTAETSGVFTDLPVTWAARAEDPSGGKTSPEELLAAAHASCFSMALSNGLTKDGTPPERLEVVATATFEPGEGVKAIGAPVRQEGSGIPSSSGTRGFWPSSSWSAPVRARRPCS